MFIPFTVGGGIRTVEDFGQLLREGADKISVNSAAIDRSGADTAMRPIKFGSQCVVVATDAETACETAAAGTSISTAAGLDAGMDALEWAKKADGSGCRRDSSDQRVWTATVRKLDTIWRLPRADGGCRYPFL